MPFAQQDHCRDKEPRQSAQQSPAEERLGLPDQTLAQP